jgi:hypothetical protein
MIKFYLNSKESSLMVKRVTSFFTIFSVFSVFSNSLYGETWIDPDTYLMWEVKTNYNIMYEYSWKEATRYCDELVLDGYDDWWLPSTMQLRSLSNVRMYGEYGADWDEWYLKAEEYKNNGFFIKTIFQYNIGSEGDYWSVSDNASISESEEAYVWFVDFEAGYDDWTYASSQHYVRCVRASY